MTKKKRSKVLDKAIITAVILPDPQNQGTSEIGTEIGGFPRHYFTGVCPNRS